MKKLNYAADAFQEFFLFLENINAEYVTTDRLVTIRYSKDNKKPIFNSIKALCQTLPTVSFQDCESDKAFELFNNRL